MPGRRGRLHAGLGHAYRTLGEPARARDHLGRALAIYTELGTSHAEQNRAELAAAG